MSTKTSPPAKIQVHLFSSPLRDPVTKELPEYIEQCIDSWKSFFRHPSFTERFVVQEWSEKDNEPIQLQCSSLYDALASHPLGAKAKIDIFKWEVLYEFGGVFIDPNVHFISPWNEDMMTPVEDFATNPFSCFVSYKHESTFGKQLSTSVVKFPPKHPLLKSIIQQMKSIQLTGENAHELAKLDVSFLCGDVLFTKTFESFQALRHTGVMNHLPIVLPSYYFSPYEPLRGHMYNGHGRVYAAVIADNLLSPISSSISQAEYASILQTEREEGLDWTNVKQVLERFVHPSFPLDIENAEHPWCLMIVFGGIDPPESLVTQWIVNIAQQQGGLLFGIELVWINDIASSVSTKRMLNTIFQRFVENTRNTSVQVYCPSFSVKTQVDYDKVMTKATQLFPNRDLVLHFQAEKHVTILQDLMFIARQMDLEDDENAAEE